MIRGSGPVSRIAQRLALQAYESRIASLTQEKFDLEQRLDQINSQLDTLRSRVPRLKTGWGVQNEAE